VVNETDSEVADNRSVFDRQYFLLQVVGYNPSDILSDASRLIPEEIQDVSYPSLHLIQALLQYRG
jgi:hypothetical protein